MFQILKTPGHRVLIKPDQVQLEKKVGSIVIPDIDGKRAKQAAGVTGVVVEIGDTCWKEFGGEPWCQVGDRVLYAKYAGVSIEDDNHEQQYVILNDEDILSVISKE